MLLHPFGERRVGRQIVQTEIPQGAVFTALVDPKTLYAVWIGTATADVLDNPTFDTTRKRLDYGVTKMFSQLPRWRSLILDQCMSGSAPGAVLIFGCEPGTPPPKSTGVT